MRYKLIGTAILAISIITTIADTVKAEYNKDEKNISEVVLLSGNLSHSIIGDTLVGLEVFDDESTDPYTKYGYEFSGHCYTCNMVDFIIMPNEIIFYNACSQENTDRISYSYETIESRVDIFRIKTENDIELCFEKISDAPIFSLKIKGDITRDSSGFPAFALYYTTSSDLKKFSVQDCGEFDG